MRIQSSPNINGSVVTVTNTATGLYDLINTAASTSAVRAGYSVETNGLDITPETGDIRVTWDGTTPTAALGQLLYQGVTYQFRSRDLSALRLIRVGGSNVTCSIVLGICAQTDAEGAVAGDFNATVSLDEFPAAAVLADNTALPTTTQVGAALEGYDGTNLDLVRVGQTANSTTVTGFLNSLPMARYNASPTARTEGQFGNIQADANGNVQTNAATLFSGEDQTNGVIAVVRKPLAVNTYSSSKTQSNSFTTTNLKATAGNLLGFRVINTTASTRYLQFHNTATTPGGGATAQEKWQINANSSLTIGEADLPTGGLYFATGIAYANSSAAATYTAGSAGDLLLDVNFI